MDVLYRMESATAAEVMESLPDPPSYSAVRALLRILEQKGHIRHEERAGKYVFMPTLRRDQAKRRVSPPPLVARREAGRFCQGTPRRMGLWARRGKATVTCEPVTLMVPLPCTKWR